MHLLLEYTLADDYLERRAALREEQLTALVCRPREPEVLLTQRRPALQVVVGQRVLEQQMHGPTVTSDAQVMFPASAAMVVSSPCPVRTTVSPGSVSSRARIDARIVGSSL